QHLLDQFEDRRQVLILRFGEIEIFFPWIQPIESIDVILGNIDAARVVRVGPSEFLQRDLPLAREKPVDKYLPRIGMRCAHWDAERTARGARAAALLPIFGVEITDRQFLLHGFADFATGVAANTK